MVVVRRDEKRGQSCGVACEVVGDRLLRGCNVHRIVEGLRGQERQCAEYGVEDEG